MKGQIKHHSHVYKRLLILMASQFWGGQLFRQVIKRVLIIAHGEPKLKI